MADDFACFLFDNGSVRADSTRSLRAVAGRLGERLGHPVRPVSLLHSTRVAAAELDGVRAELLEPALDDWFSGHPQGRALLIPLFFGPSGALTDYVPERLASLRERHPGTRTVLAEALVMPEEQPAELVAILADRVRATAAERGWRRPKVVLCDHGTPQRAVTAVRDRLAVLLGEALAGEAAMVAPASMERREGRNSRSTSRCSPRAWRRSPLTRARWWWPCSFCRPDAMRDRGATWLKSARRRRRRRARRARFYSRP